MLKRGALLIGLVALASSAFAQVDYGPVTGWGYFSIGQSTSSPEHIKRIFSGGDVLYGLREDGSFFAQGNDQTGSTGFPLGLANAAQVSVGNGFSVVLNTAGRATAYGKNNAGQASVPPSLPNLKYVSAGDQAVLAVTTAGTVTGWGSTGYGILTPPAGLNHVVKVATGNFHGVALKSDGTVVAWGNDSFHQTEVPAGLTGVVDIQAGREHTVALKSDGTVVAWGDNSKGQCSIPASAVPYVRISANQFETGLLTLGGTATVIGAYPGRLSPVPGHHYVDIGATTTGMYGLLESGQLSAVFGDSGSTPLGLPLELRDAIQVFSGNVLHVDGSVTAGSHVVTAGVVTAITKTGGMLFSNGHGIDNGVDLTGLKQVDYLTALRTDGTVYYHANNGPTTLPTNIVQICGALANSIGANSSSGAGARSATGSLFVWGDNSYGQTSSMPTGLTNIIDFSYNRFTVAAVNSSGAVTAWGRNDYGQTNVPAGLAHVIKVDTGYYSTVALKNDGSIVQWGSAPGAIGAYTTTLAPIPARCNGGAQLTAENNQSLRPLGIFTNWDSFNGNTNTIFTGEVTLTKASTADTTVALAATDPGVQIPASVVVPAGKHFVTFPINMAATASGTYSIVASLSGFNATTSFLMRVDDIDFSSVTPYSGAINSGDNVMVQVRFTHPALHPYPLHITTSSNLEAMPLVDVPAGAISVVFPVASFPTATNTTESITVSGSLGRTMSGTVNLRPVSIDLTGVSFVGAGHAAQQYTLRVGISRPAPASGVTVNYTPISGPSTDSGTITIPAGATSATKGIYTQHSSVYPYAVLKMQVSFGSSSAIAQGQVYPDQPQIFVYSSTVLGGQGNTLVVQIPSAAPAGGTVAQLSSQYDHTVGLTLGMPTTATVPAGATTVTVPITTTAVTAPDTVYIIANFDASTGLQGAQTHFVVVPPHVTALTLNPTSLVGGGHSTGTVTISNPAPAGGTVVQLNVQDSDAVFLPHSTVTIPAGATSATFDVATTSVTTTQTARIGATINGVGVQATLTVTP